MISHWINGDSSDHKGVDQRLIEGSTEISQLILARHALDRL
ncbi:hypothetical protein ACIQI7_21915 [Kitasatospora sp. NPDC092039]